VVQASAAAVETPATVLYRVFLKDGTPLVSYGECTRDGDRIVFAVPLGLASKPAALQVVSLPLSTVDWERTVRYTETVRFRQYAATRGEADYTALSAEVARALTEIALSADPARKLTVARQARALLADWPRTHYGFRSREVRELASMIDEAISQVQADLGLRAFSIDLVAQIEPPAGELLPDPSLEESVALARTAAITSQTPAERVSLLQAILAVLGPRDRTGPSRLTAELRRTVERDLRGEEETTRQYSAMASDALKAAARRVADGDVAGVERIAADVRAADTRLGRRRVDEVESLLATLRAQLDAARARRLALDQWTYRTRTYAPYREQVGAVLSRLGRLIADMDAIRAMSGPDASALPKLLLRVTEARMLLLPADPPAELRDVHDNIESVVSLMEQAARQRQYAVMTADAQLSRNASAAAAGAVLLLDRARAGLDAFFQRPESP
jgi:hypothetical protein